MITLSTIVAKLNHFIKKGKGQFCDIFNLRLKGGIECNKSHHKKFTYKFRVIKQRVNFLQILGSFSFLRINMAETIVS